MPTHQTPSPVALPAQLESPRAKLVYMYLSTVGEATIAELTTHLKMKRLTAFSILQTLLDRELVTQEGDRYAAVTP